MRIKHLLFLMLMALIMPLAANAQVECKLTVNNGTDMYERVPAYGGRRCDQWYRNEFIIDKAYLQEMAGKEIIGMTLYVAVPVPSSYIGNQGSYSVRIREMQYATDYGNDNPSFYINPNTTLAHQEVNGGTDVDGKSSIWVRFDTPFLYSGEHNLVVQFQSDKHNWTTSPFGIDNLPLYYGINQMGCALEYCNEEQETTYLDNGSWLHPNNAVRNFAPKVTFTYRDEPKWANTNKPQNPVATVLSTSSIKLEWEAGNYTGSTYQVLCVERGTTPNWSSAVSVSNTTYTFENLASNTTYDLYVRSKKVQIITYTSNAASATATTQRNGNLDDGPMVFDFSEGTHPNGLTVACDDSHLVTYDGNLSYTGENSVTVTLPQLQYTNATNGLMLEFDLYQPESSLSPVRVELIDEGYNETPFSQNLTSHSNYQHFSFRLKDNMPVSSSSTFNHYIMRFTATGSFSLDNINVRKLDNIIPPYDLAATDITTTSATISWKDDNENSHSLKLYYRQKGATAWNNPIDVSGTSHTLTNLTPYTQYEVMVKAIVGSSAESSATLQFATQCPAMETPYTMDFTGLTELPQYWKIERGPQNVSIDYEIDDQGISFGSVTSTSQYNRDAYIIMPYFVNLSSLQLSLEMISIYNCDYYTSNRFIEVGVMSDPFDVSTFKHISDVGCSSTTVPSSINVNLNTNLQHGHIAIKLESGYVRLDSFVVTRAAAPTNLEVLTTNISAMLSWTSTATEWQVRYKATSASDWESAITVTEPTCTITGLTANTEYQAQVRAKYGDNQYSAWGEGNFGTFKTLIQEAVVMNAGNASYYEDFESGIGNWLFIDGGSGNRWKRSSYNNQFNGDQGYGLRITNSEATGMVINYSWQYSKRKSYTINNQTNYLPTPATSYAVKTFTLTAGHYALDYRYAVKGIADEDYMRVVLVPAETAIEAGVMADGFSYNTTPDGWFALDGGQQLTGYSANYYRWKDKATVTLDVYPGGTCEPGNYMIVVLWNNEGSERVDGQNPPGAIDNVSVTWSPVVYAPSMASQVTTDTEATLSIIAPASGITPTSYEVQYIPEADYTSNNNEYGDAPIATFNVTEPPHTLTGLTPMTSYAVRVRSVYTANGKSIYSDWQNYGPWFTTKCPRPTNLVLVDQTTSWARVMWTPVEMALSETQYINYWYQLTTDINDWGAEHAGLASNGWNENLAPGEYHFRVKTVVYEQPNSAIGSGDWSEPIEFTIAPWAESVTSFPQAYGFEEPLYRFADGITLSGDFDRFGFYRYENQQDQLPAHAGGESQYLLAYTSGSNSEACLVLPAMAPSSGTANLLVSFWWYHFDSETNSNVGVTIEYSSDNGTTWQAAGDKITRFANETGWAKYQQRIFAYTKTYIRLRFTGAASQQWWTRCYLDDLNVDVFKSYTPYIAEVTCNGTTANITLYDYALEHDLYSTKVEVQYREYREPGQPEEEWTTYEPEFDLEAPYTFENHLAVNGLYPYTAYEFRARAKASMPMPDGNGNYTANWSDYSEAYLQWTGCGTYTITPSRSFSEGFEDEITVACWTGDISELDWHLTTDEAHSGTSSVCVNGKTYKTLSTPTIDLTQLSSTTDNVIMRFWAKTSTTGCQVLVRYTYNETTYNPRYMFIPKTDEWKQFEISLSKRMGREITVEFKNGSANTDFYLDDIEIIANPYSNTKIFDLGEDGYAANWTSSNVWFPDGTPDVNTDVRILEGSVTANSESNTKSVFVGPNGRLTVKSTLNVEESLSSNIAKINTSTTGVISGSIIIGSEGVLNAGSLSVVDSYSFKVNEGGTANITTLNPGVANSVIVKDGGLLNATVINGVSSAVADRDKILIESGGQVKSSNDFAGIMEKSFKGYGAENVNSSTDWYLVASPTNVSAIEFVPKNGTEYLFEQIDMYRFDGNPENGLEWKNLKCSDPDGCAAPGGGTTPQGEFTGAIIVQPTAAYLYACQEDGTVRFATGSMGDVKFPATNVDKNVHLTYSTGSNAPFNGWNLIGNPFTCDAYVKRGDTYLSFYKMNDKGDKIVLAEAGTPIKPCEGVFVQCDENVNTQTAVFTSTAPSRGNSIDFSLRQTNIRSIETIDRTRISFDDGQNLGHLDVMANPNRLYFPNGNKDLAVIQAQPVGEMPLNFKPKVNGSFTIGFESATEGLVYCHLIDNLTGADIDLLQQPEYTFEANVSDYSSRFRVLFAKVEDNDEDSDDFAFIYNGNIIVNGIGTLQVFDILGRQLFSHEVNSAFRIPHSEFPTGVYVLRLIDGDKVKTQKVIKN